MGATAIRSTRGTRILVNANFPLRRSEGDTTTSLGMALNGLF